MEDFPRKLDLLDDGDMRFFRKVYKAHGVRTGTYDYDFSDSLATFADWSRKSECICFRSKSILCAGFAMQDSLNRSRGIGRLDLMRGLPTAASWEAGLCFDYFESWCRLVGVDIVEFTVDVGMGRVSARDRWMRSRGLKEGFRLYVKELSYG